VTSQPPPGYPDSPWGDPVEGGASASPAAPSRDSVSAPLEPLARRLLGAAGLLSVLLIGVVANAVLHSGGNPFNPIATAAVRTQAAPGARFSIEVAYTSASLPQPVIAHGSGAYNSRTGRSWARLAVPSPTGTQMVRTVADPQSLYTRSQAISAGLPPGRPWLGVEPWMGRSESAALAGSGSAADQLGMLRAVSSDVESLGDEAIRGTLTHRYRGSIELGRYAELLREEGKAASAHQYEQVAKLMPAPLEVEVWVDDAGMARRLREVMTLPTSSGHPPVTTDLRMDLFGFGVEPKVKLPAADEVFDSTPLARAELDLLEGDSVRDLVAAAGEPLSASAYRRRSSTICTGIERGIEALRKRSAPERAAMERFGRDGGTRSHSPQETLRAFRMVSAAYFEPVLATIEAGLARLGRLSPPPDRAPAFHHFMRLSAMYVEIDLAETRAVEIGQLKLAQSLSDRLHSMSAQLGRATHAAGLASICSADDEPGSHRGAGSGTSA
jgi:hypothetical protein